MILRVLTSLADRGDAGDAGIEQSVRADVGALCARFPIYETLAYP